MGVADSGCMKIKTLTVSLLAAALLIPVAVRADDHDKAKEAKDKVKQELSEADRKTHEKICEGHHGTVTEKSGQSISIDGKRYAYMIGTPQIKGGGALPSKIVAVGDHVCFTTQKAADGTEQVAQVIAVPKDEKVRVREKEEKPDVDVDVDVDKKPAEVK